MANEIIKHQAYKHYLGREYYVLGTGSNEKTDEEYIIYSPLYGGKVLIISMEEWIKPVLFNGKNIKPFELMKEPVKRIKKIK